MADQLTADSLIGQTIGGRFVATALLGEGGMGYVFKAVQQPMGREVALKILKEDYMSDDVIRERFLREAEAIARMTHPNIVTLYDSGHEESKNILFMAMEYLHGKPLSDLIADELDQFNLGRLLSACAGIAAALSEAHKQGIIHRDLKPENVFLIRDHEGVELPKVLDFGFARLQGSTKKLTQFGVAFGTPHYMSPEQAMGQLDITAAADIYAVGVMMFEMVTGDVPYNGKNAMEIMQKQVSAPIPDLTPRPGLEVPKALTRLIRQCMAKDPKQRPADGNALFDALQNIREGKGLAASNSSALATTPMNAGDLPLNPAVGLHKKQLIIIGLVVLLAVVTAVALTLMFAG